MPKIRNGWLVGRYNGEPIVGGYVYLILDIGQLRIRRYWLPKVYWKLGTYCVIWLCFQLRFNVRYGW